MSQFELNVVLEGDALYNWSVYQLIKRNRQGKITDRQFGHIRARLVTFALRRFQRGERQVAA